MRRHELLPDLSCWTIVDSPDQANDLVEPISAPQTDSSTPAPARIRLTKLSVAELQAMYREVVGRETRSSDSAYLVWKLRQAQKGRIRVGPIRRRASGEAVDIKVLPLRMTTAEAEALDEAWRRLGFRSRTALLKKAIEAMLA